MNRYNNGFNFILINQAFLALLAFYIMFTNSETGFNYFLNYIIAMCGIGFFDMAGTSEEVLAQLNILLMAVFTCFTLFKVFMIIKNIFNKSRSSYICR